jgi:hypothetical protein
MSGQSLYNAAPARSRPADRKLPVPMRIAIILALGVASWAPIVLLLT